MNEFWALILGSFLGILGGFAGTLFTHFLQNRKEKKEEVKEAYIRILTFCNRAKLLLMNNKELNELLAENNTYGQLYASVKVQQQYDLVIDAISKLFDTNIQEYEYMNQTKIINALICVLVAQIKKELGFSDENSKKLLKLTLEKKEDK